MQQDGGNDTIVHNSILEKEKQAQWAQWSTLYYKHQQLIKKKNKQKTGKLNL